MTFHALGDVQTNEDLGDPRQAPQPEAHHASCALFESYTATSYLISAMLATHVDDEPLGTRVFHPAKPDELCQRAIKDVLARHRLSLAPDVVYLEAMVSDSSDVSSNQWKGPLSAAGLAVLWMLVACYVGARDAFSEWRRRRRTHAR